MEPDGDFEVDKVIEEMILLNTGNYHFDLIRKIKTNESEGNRKSSEIKNIVSTQENNTQEQSNLAEKSEKEEINDLKVIVQQMKDEIEKLKQHKCSTSINKNTPKVSKPTDKPEFIQTILTESEKTPSNAKSLNKCEFCEKTFEDRDALCLHVKEKHEKPYECNFCAFTSKVQNTLEQHKEEKHVMNFKCNKCKYTSMNEDILKAHMKIHNKKARLEEFNCDTCDFQDNKRNALKKHLDVSPGHKPSSKDYECRNCKMIFSSYFNLMNHRSVAHPSNMKCRYFKVGKCNFSSEECWYSHEKTAPQKDASNANEKEMEDFQIRAKTLPPDMNILINQLLKMASEKQS